MIKQGIMGGKQIKKAMGGRIGLKEGNGKDDSMTGIAMAIEERMRKLRELMEQIEKVKKAEKYEYEKDKSGSSS